MRRNPSRQAPKARLAEVDLSSLDDVEMWDGHTVKVGGEDIFVRHHSGHT